MSEAVVDDIVAVLPPLLQSLEALSFIARHLNPPQFGSVMEAAGIPDQDLRAAHARLSQWPPEFSDLRAPLETAIAAALAAFDGLRAVQHGNGDLVAVFRALRHAARAQEALYPLAAKLPPVSSFFVDPALREDADLAARLAAPATENTGIMHDHNEPGSRGGFSLYVPEYYTPERAWPLVMALHGGSGNGRGFLWSWLRDARSFGAILVAPTATGGAAKSTWALMGEDTDTPNLAGILAAVQNRWNVDPTKLLLTGMSDGGTFCYVSGLESASPFTHLAPVSATFHPLMAEMADADRLRGLPVYLVHGRLDWMFPV
jgi:phospholipase/carboxylesterase